LQPFEIQAGHPCLSKTPGHHLAANTMTASLYLSDRCWRKDTAPR